ncbi:MAG TPA: SIS domain-containing protein [Longimicrobiales bacterium]|nr:SIS domain-containing protein [Longimicrobiales bacterium]
MHTRQYLAEVAMIAQQLRAEEIDAMAAELARLRDGGGRVFFLGVGGSAANASHATNDFRKLAGFEAYCVTDNVSELTARTNDDGWHTTFVEYLRGSRLSRRDGVFVMSVGGGDAVRDVSANIVHAVRLAGEVGARVFGIVGRDGGYTATVADACIVIPSPNPDMVTPHTESFQAVVWHLLVSHPLLLQGAMKWENVTP